MCCCSCCFRVLHRMMYVAQSAGHPIFNAILWCHACLRFLAASILQVQLLCLIICAALAFKRARKSLSVGCCTPPLQPCLSQSPPQHLQTWPFGHLLSPTLQPRRPHAVIPIHGSPVQDVLAKLSWTAAGELSPMAAIFGGIVWQETMKAISGKFHPIHQFLYFDAVEALPASPPSPSELSGKVRALA